jgi:hypothetical protein
MRVGICEANSLRRYYPDQVLGIAGRGRFLNAFTGSLVVSQTCKSMRRCPWERSGESRPSWSLRERGRRWPRGIARRGDWWPTRRVAEWLDWPGWLEWPSFAALHEGDPNLRIEEHCDDDTLVVKEHGHCGMFSVRVGDQRPRRSDDFGTVVPGRAMERVA